MKSQRTLDDLDIDEIKKCKRVTKTDEFGDTYQGNIEAVATPGDTMLDPDDGQEVLENKDQDRVSIWWHSTPNGEYRSFDARDTTFDSIYVEDYRPVKVMVPVAPQCALCKKFSLLGGICRDPDAGVGPNDECFDQAV